MLLTKKQFLIIIAALVISCGSWAIILKMFIDSSLELKWSFLVWFFGGCFASAFIFGVHEWIECQKIKNRTRIEKIVHAEQVFLGIIDSKVNPQPSIENGEKNE